MKHSMFMLLHVLFFYSLNANFFLNLPGYDQSPDTVYIPQIILDSLDFLQYINQEISSNELHELCAAMEAGQAMVSYDTLAQGLQAASDALATIDDPAFNETKELLREINLSIAQKDDYLFLPAQKTTRKISHEDIFNKEIPEHRPANLRSISFDVDLDTGISSPIADTLVLSTGSVGRVLIDDLGDLIIPGAINGGTINLGGSLITDDALTITGSFPLTFITTVTSTVTLPATGTLTTLAGAETLVNKTLTSPVLNSASLVTPVVTDVLTVPSGSASVPSIVFSGDTNTGLSAPTADTLVLSTGGANRLQIGSSGALTIPGAINGGMISLGGALNTAGALTTSGAYALTLTTTAATNITLPATGTLTTLAGAETLVNKTLTSPLLNTPSISAATLMAPVISDVLTVPSGSASAPSIVFSGDTNTGLSAPSADTLILSTGGANRLQIGSGGALTIPGAINGGTISLGGALNTAGALTTSGANPLTLTTSGSTNVTLPTSGSLTTGFKIGTGSSPLKVVSGSGSLTLGSLSLSGSTTIDISSAGFASTPTVMITASSNILGLGIGVTIFSSSGTTSTSLKVNILVATAVLGSNVVSFDYLLIGV